MKNDQSRPRLACWVWRPETETVEYSAEYREILNMSEDVRSGAWRDMLRSVHPEDAGRVDDAITAMLGAGEAYEIVYRIVCRDGTERTLV